MAKKIFNFGERLALYDDLIYKPENNYIIDATSVLDWETIIYNAHLGEYIEIEDVTLLASLNAIINNEQYKHKLNDLVVILKLAGSTYTPDSMILTSTSILDDSSYSDADGYGNDRLTIHFIGGERKRLYHFAFIYGDVGYGDTTWYYCCTKYYDTRDIDFELHQVRTQYNIMPAASLNYWNYIVQYVGSTNQNYTNGYFYKCVSDGQNPATYSWEQVDVQTQGTPFYLGSASDYTSQNPLDISVLEPGLYCIGVNTWNDVLYVNGNVNGVPLTGTLSVAAGNSSFNNYIAYLQLTQKINTCTPTTSGVNVGKVYINATYAGQETVAYHTKSLRVIINSAGTACTIDNSSSSVFTLKVVTQNDNQTITGRKTFSTLPETSIAPTENYHMVNKKYVDDAIVAAVAEIDITSREIVQTLPTQDISTKTIYMVPSSTPGIQNVYDEYMYINNAWELIGSTAIDLSNYYTKTEVDAMVQALAAQIGNISSVLAQLVDTVEPLNTTLYTENVTVGGNSGTYTVVAKEHHIDTDYYVLEYTFENTSNNTIEGLMLDEIYDDGVNPAQHVPLLWIYDIEPGEIVTLTSYWQDPVTYQVSLDKYDDDQNITIECDETDNATTFTQDLPLANLGFTTDVVAHTTAYNSSDVTGGFTCTTFDRTGGSEDPYTVPEEFRVVWINQNNQTFGTLSEPVSGSLTMTRSYHGFDAAQFDSTNTKFFLAKTADIVNCTYQEFLDAYNAFINGGV